MAAVEVIVGGSSLRLSKERALKRTEKVANLAAISAMAKVDFVPRLSAESNADVNVRGMRGFGSAKPLPPHIYDSRYGSVMGYILEEHFVTVSKGWR